MVDCIVQQVIIIPFQLLSCVDWDDYTLFNYCLLTESYHNLLILWIWFNNIPPQLVYNYNFVWMKDICTFKLIVSSLVTNKSSQFLKKGLINYDKISIYTSIQIKPWCLPDSCCPHHMLISEELLLYPDHIKWFNSIELKYPFKYWYNVSCPSCFFMTPHSNWCYTTFTFYQLWLYCDLNSKYKTWSLLIMKQIVMKIIFDF